MVNEIFSIIIITSIIFIASSTPILYSRDNDNGPESSISEVEDTEMTDRIRYKERRKYGALIFLFR